MKPFQNELEKLKAMLEVADEMIEITSGAQPSKWHRLEDKYSDLKSAPVEPAKSAEDVPLPDFLYTNSFGEICIGMHGDTVVTDEWNRWVLNQFASQSPKMPMFEDDSNMGNEKRDELMAKRSMSDANGEYSQGFADCFNWVSDVYKSKMK